MAPKLTDFFFKYILPQFMQLVAFIAKHSVNKNVHIKLKAIFGGK